MDDINTDKKYGSYKIPNRRQLQESGVSKTSPQSGEYTQISFSDGLFYEIDYDNSPIPGAGKFVLKSEKIEPPHKDEIRELFYRMRDIARQYPFPHTDYSRFFDRRVQQGNARIFYMQGIFMKDFEDDYPEQVPFSSYFPYYQMLGYEQLRTYFSWRTKVRKGSVANTSLSYAYLYVYELLNNIGADNPQDGLDRLMFFWTSFRDYDSSIDKYIIRWLKDYHIYYDLPKPFKEFVREHNLTEHYPNIADTENCFDLFCAISKYDIRKSAFFSEDNSRLITDCFNFVIKSIRQEFEKAGISFNDSLFYPTKKLVTWTPFKGALFYNWLKQPDRRVVFSENEIYVCSNNEWSFSTIITTDSGRQFIAYVMKQMESVLRTVKKYKYKITANMDMMNQDTVRKLQKAGIFIDNIVKSATMEFFREANKIVVTVDHTSLNRIRQEAYATQEALIVEDEFDTGYPLRTPAKQSCEEHNIFAELSDKPDNSGLTDTQAGYSGFSDTKTNKESGFDTEPEAEPDVWDGLGEALSELELQALAVILQGESNPYDNIKEYADRNKIMLEVLVDGINEKAMDYIGDNILDDEFSIYEEYIEHVKGMVER